MNSSDCIVDLQTSVERILRAWKLFELLLTSSYEPESSHHEVFGDLGKGQLNREEKKTLISHGL